MLNAPLVSTLPSGTFWSLLSISLFVALRAGVGLRWSVSCRS